MFSSSGKSQVAKNAKIVRGDYVFAVSRRFGIQEVDDLFEQSIEPGLNQAGHYLICSNAPMDLDSIENWIPRMALMLDVADVHIIMDFEHSENTIYENEASNLSCLFGTRLLFYWCFGLVFPIKVNPIRIIFYDQRVGFNPQSLSYVPDPIKRKRNGGLKGSTLLAGLDLRRGADDVRKQVSQHLAKALSFVDQSRAYSSAQFDEPMTAMNYAGSEWALANVDVPVVAPQDLIEIKRLIARRLHDDVEISAIQDEMITSSPADAEGRSFLVEHVDVCAEVIRDYNYFIKEAAELTAKRLSGELSRKEAKEVQQKLQQVFDLMELIEIDEFDPEEALEILRGDSLGWIGRHLRFSTTMARRYQG